MSGKSNFKPQQFIDEQTKAIRKILGKEKAIIACSGGVDSTVCAALTKKAIGENLICVFIDTNFMRLDEPEQVFKTLSNPPINLPVKLLSAQSRFMNALKGMEDAEEKRKAFRSTFYNVLSEAAKEEKCHFLVQGTILPDIIETVGGIKTQHNVLEQLKIDTREVYGFKLVEPLVSLYKPQVRAVGKKLGLPSKSYERQPFPGPGLSVRVVGIITPEKLEVEKKVTVIVERELESLSPKQYFPAIIDAQIVKYSKESEVEEAVANLVKGKGKTVKAEVLRTRATGIRDGKRLYGKIVTIEIRDEKDNCLELTSRILSNLQNRVTSIDGDVSRVLYRLNEKEQTGKWVIAVRSVETSDFVTASASNIPWKILKKIGEQLRDISNDVSAMYYDITPKPPSSIEFE